MKFITDWKECFDQVQDLLAAPAPVFLSRVGGSDTNAVAAYLEAKALGTDHAWQAVLRQRPVVESFNGYYDIEQSEVKFVRYLESLIKIYSGSREMFFCNHQLLSLYFPDNINPKFRTDEFEFKRGYEILVSLIDGEGHGARSFPYPFVEKLASHHYTLMEVFASLLVGLKVLVISPFAESIVANFHNRAAFFKDYRYPEFDLVVYNTPITYAGLPPGHYPHRDWFETTEAMQQDISKLNFDIALLSCGSYAMPLGQYIASTIGKKSVYVGGVLQLMFGVHGRRYDNPFFTDQINLDKFITPLEAGHYLQHINIAPDALHESFGAYF